jgi:hypothetical protein
VKPVVILRVFKLAVGPVALAIVAATSVAGDPSQALWWALALPMLAWMVGPGAASYFVAAKRPTAPRLVVMGLFFLAFATTAALGYYDGLINPDSSTGSLITIFLPLYQWGVLLMVLLLLWGFEWLTDRGKSQS